MHMPKPDWLKIKARSNEETSEVERIIGNLCLNTVCEEAGCPNRMECFGRKTAAFMIMGRFCTRNCTFCNVEKNVPTPLDPAEPAHLAQAVRELNLAHVVVTSVTRDDLPDGGAGHFAAAIEEIRRLNRNTTIEVLIPDFMGDAEALLKVVNAKPDIINHNIETVPRLYPQVRPMAVYERSIELLGKVKSIAKGIFTKSGIMLGLGEMEQEVIGVFKDLRSVSCDFLTVGQYLAPSKKHYPVAEYVHPEVFEKFRQLGLGMGFKHVASGPLVRSSYMADRVRLR